MNKKVSVCYVCDDEFFIPTVVSVTSLLDNRSERNAYDVFIIMRQARPDQQEMVRHLDQLSTDCSVQLLERTPQVPEGVSGRVHQIPPYVLLKFQLGEILSNLDRVICLDSDTIVQSDLTELFSLELNDHYAAAVQDLIGYQLAFHRLRYDELVGVPFAGYFNDGVMLLNLEQLRRDDVASQLVEFRLARRDLILVDQDAFNAVFAKRVLLVGREYNLMPDCVRIPKLRKAAAHPNRAKILHFASTPKPWVTRKVPWARIYESYWERSPASSEYYRSRARSIQASLQRKLSAPLRQLAAPLSQQWRKDLRGSRVTLRAQLAKDISRAQRKNREDLRAFLALQQLQESMRTNTESGLNTEQQRPQKIVVSLTTIQERFYEIGPTIESMLCQTLRPDQIILWLDRDRVGPEDVPISLKKQQQRGLTIRFCEDIGPHTKLIPALKAFPEDVVITVDDDVFYPPDLIERLFAAYRKDPSKIYCTRARHVDTLDVEKFTYLSEWVNLYTESEGLNVLPLGVGGVLYPPHSLDDEVFNLAAQKELAPKADDIWFKAMSLRKGVVCKKLPWGFDAFPLRPSSQDVDLGQFNVREGGNEVQIKATFERYGLWEVLDAARHGQDEPTPKLHIPRAVGEPAPVFVALAWCKSQLGRLKK